LVTIARHRAIDAARAAASRPAVPVADIGVVAGSADRPATVRSAEGDALESISTADAIALVKLLPPDQAEAVALRVIGGLDVAAVAEMLGKSAGAVRVNVHRGLRSLQEMSQQGKLPLESREVV